MFTFLSGCAQIKLEDVPIIKKIYLGGEVVCIYEVKFISGNDRCIDAYEYHNSIEPYEVILPYESFQFFKKISLQACQLADKSAKASCEQDVKSIDDWVKAMIEISKGR